MRFHLLSLTFFICLSCLLLKVDAEPYLKAIISDVSCFGKKDGKIQLVFSGIQPSEFRISVLDTLNQKIAVFESQENESMLIEDLSKGTYSVQITTPDTTEVQVVLINSPAKLQLEMIRIIEVQGSGTSLLSTLQALPVGGTPPYTSQWSENSGNQQGMIAKKLPLGIYNCKVNDKNKCGDVEATFYLFEDEIESFKASENIK
jgi:hypothetical protein